MTGREISLCRRIHFQKGAGSLFEQILAAWPELAGRSGLCGGTGRCGRCRVRFLSQAPLPSSADRRFLTPVELREGYRLACTARPCADGEVEICFAKGREAKIVTASVTEEETAAAVAHIEAGAGEKDAVGDGARRLFCAVDLGTTTVVMQLIDLVTGDCVHTYAFQNPQRAYGADVLSRILAAENGKAGALQEALTAELKKGLLQMEAKGRPERVIISGNTAMGHILLGYPAGSLGRAPFTPYHIGSSRFDLCGYPALFMPGISAFVGADIVSGMYACGMANNKEHSLFIDLGTNGEMAVGNSDRILCTAAAAGSAFEGSVCPHILGTDLTAIAFDLLADGIMDESGLLQEPWFTEGYRTGGVVIRQQDIRNLQMAKAAICTGVEILLERMGLWDRIAHVYLAGGFGYYLDVDKAVGIGLIPAVLQEKCQAVGNTSLAGAVRYGRLTGKAVFQNGERGTVVWDDGMEEKKLQHIIEISHCLNLAEQPEFAARYVDAMTFQRIGRRE